nr:MULTISPECIES: acyltransferase [Vibrio]
MPLYKNIYLTGFDGSSSLLGQTSAVCGDPDLTFTWCYDKKYNHLPVNKDTFKNVISIGERCYLESRDILAFPNSKIKLTSVKVNDGSPGIISIANNVVLQGTCIISYESVTVEDNVTFGPGVTIMDSDGHPLLGRGESDEAERILSKPVIIKEHAWIGKGATILKGVTVGEHAVVSTNSVVTRDVPAYSIVMGNPAKVVKNIKSI